MLSNVRGAVITTSGDRDPHDLNAIAAYAEHRLTGEERDRVERHLVACADCRATLAMYARVAAAEAETAVSSGALRIRVPATWLALAASAVLAVGVSLYIRMNPGPAAPAIEGARPAPPAVQGSPAVESPAVSPPAQAPPQPSREDGGLSKMRSGTRRVGEKLFRLEAGAWVDTAFDPLHALPIMDISTTEARAALLKEKPALRLYADLGPHVTVVLDGQVYRFEVK